MGPVAYRFAAVAGLEWLIVVAEELEWLRVLLARVALLKPVSPCGRKTIVFVTTEAGQRPDKVLASCGLPVPAGGLPRDGWRSEKPGLVDFRSHPAVPYVFGLVDGRRDPVLDVIQAQEAFYPVITEAVAAGGLNHHAALVERTGRGFLIAAAGGTGKSTCCERLRPPWRALSDDEVLIVPGPAGACRAHPLPTWSRLWSEQHGIVTDIAESVDLSALLFLKQSPADGIAPLPKGEVALSLYKSAADACGKYTIRKGPVQARLFRERLMDNACQIANYIPAYLLKASLTGQFWVEIENVIGIR